MIQQKLQKPNNILKKKLHFEDIKFEKKKMKKRILLPLAFLVIKTKRTPNLCLKKKCFAEKHVDLLLMGEEGKRYYVIINDFNALMFDDTLHCGRKLFCCYCSLPFCAVEILKLHIKDCFKINGK